MKKISIFILAVSCVITYISCENPEQLEPSSPEQADSEAYAAYIENCSNPGGAYSEICAMGAGMSAADASEAFANGGTSSRSSQSLAKHDESEILLPEKYKIKNNLFERSGVAHNRILFYLINSKKDRTTKDFLDGNEIALDRIAMILSESHNIDSKQIAQLKENIRPITTASYYDQNIAKYKNVTKDNLFSGSKLSSPIVAYCQGVFNGVSISKRDATTNKTEAVVGYINNKINEILISNEPLNKEMNVKLGFLSVLKHSYYYWNN